jgi:hypothetical protein
MVHLSWLDNTRGCMQIQKVGHTAYASNYPDDQNKIQFPSSLFRLIQGPGDPPEFGTQQVFYQLDMRGRSSQKPF